MLLPRDNGWLMLDVATMADEFELSANSSLKLEQRGAYLECSHRHSRSFVLNIRHPGRPDPAHRRPRHGSRVPRRR